MTIKSTSLILLTCATISTGCRSDRVLEPAAPEPPPAPASPGVLTKVNVTPARIALFRGMTKQLSVAAWDQKGRQLMWAADDVAYASSNPAIVTVSNRGILTAASPGAAMITVTMTVNGVTGTRSVTADVMELSRGNYELMAPVGESGWGLTGGIYKALLTVLPDSFLNGATAANPIGTFANLRLFGPDGVILDSASDGLVTTQIDVVGRLTVSLVVEQRVRWEGYVDSSGQHVGD